MSNVLKLAAAFAAALSIAILAAFTPPLSTLDSVAALNTAGDSVWASASISDGTGVVTTVATAGTYVTLGTAAPLVVGPTDGSGCLTYTLASNRFTVAARCGVGDIKLSACLNDVVGVNSRHFLGAWHRVRGGTTTVASTVHRETEAAAAIRRGRGCVDVVVSAQLGDTYDFRLDAQTNGDAITTRAAHFLAQKIVSR